MRTPQKKITSFANHLSCSSGQHPFMSLLERPSEKNLNKCLSMMIGRELNLLWEPERASPSQMDSSVEFVVVNFRLGLGSQLGL